jgi:hypothetical protein
MDPDNTGVAPSSTPFRINPNIPYATETTLYAAIDAGPGNPIVTPGSGYQLMIRNVPSVKGGTCSAPGTDCDPNSIYLMAIGRTTATKAYLNAESRGMNLIEDGIFGDDISIWNNIFFAGDNDLSGGGAMTIHGNVHILGPEPPPLVNTVVLDVKADILNSYYYGNANKSLKNPLRSTLSLPQQRNPNNVLDPVNNLKAKVRVRNGLIDIDQGNAKIGEYPTDGIPFDVIATCRSCPDGNSMGFTSAYTPNVPGSKVQGLQMKSYNVPANLQHLIKVPAIADEYKDPSTNIKYPTYTDYFIGMNTFGGVTYNLPGALGLKLAAAIGNDTTITFDGTLATQIWNAKTSIFTQNVREGSVSEEQQVLDPLTSETDPLFTPTIGIGPTDGKTFMVVAADTVRNVVLVYKEVAPFERSVDPDLTGTETADAMNFPRVIHGFVFAPSGTNMSNVTLKVDIDGDDVDDGDNWIYDDTAACNPLQASPPAGCKRTLTVTESNQLIRKVTNAIWKASRGECGVLGPCYSSVSKDTWESTMDSAPSHMYEAASPNYLKVTATGNEDVNGKLIAFGAIETTDRISIGGFLYAGRFTLFSRDSNNSGTAPNIGQVVVTSDVYSIESYERLPATNPSVYVSFPCQNNMGIMAAQNIDLDSTGTHDVFSGAFYSAGTFILTKQQQLLGAIVAGAWDFGAGGTPDFFQAMEISRCLPPYIIGKDVIVFADSQSWLER